MATPNKWNPNTTTVYSSSGSAKEIPIGDYDKFIGLGWGATAPVETAPIVPEETPKIETPVVPKEVPAITPEQLAPIELPDIEQPYQPIQDVFGADWKPQPVFEQLGLIEQGIYGAVRVEGTDAVYTIGEGGRKETAESYLERFGTAEQAGIVGEISVEEAKKLGINLEADTLVSDTIEEIPESFTAEMTPEQKAQVGTDILAAAEIKYGVEGLKKEKDTATTNLITLISGMWEKFEEAKEEKEEKLEIEEKNKAISDAQTAYTKVKSVYDKYINELTHSTMTTAHIGGLQAKARSQMAVELSGLASIISVAEGAYDRAFNQLQSFSNDWKEAQEWNLRAAEMKINMLGENLSEAQQKSKTEAEQKLAWFREDYERKLADRNQIMSLMVAYPQAGIRLDASLSDAFRVIMPYVSSDKEIEDRMKMIGLESAEIGLLINKKNLASGGGGYAPSAAKKLWTELGGQEGTGMSFNEFYQNEKGDSGVITFQSALEDTAKGLIELRDANKLSDMNYSQAVSGFMSDFGLEDREQVESAINNIMSGGAPVIQEEGNVGSDFDYTPLIFKDEEAIAKSRADLPHDAKLIYDELKKDNPYSSVAFLIRETLRRVGLSK